MPNWGHDVHQIWGKSTTSSQKHSIDVGWTEKPYLTNAVALFTKGKKEKKRKWKKGICSSYFIRKEKEHMVICDW
jgi:hypothetical protein